MSVLVNRASVDSIRTILIPADRNGCGMYRMIMPGQAILNTEARFDIEFGDGIRAKFDREGRVTEIPPANCDLVVMQRVMDSRLVQTIPLLQRQGVAVVVELDDDIERVDHGNTAHRWVDPKHSAQNWRHLHDACNLADLVTVSTPALARYAPHGRVAVIPNCIPTFLTLLERHEQPDHQTRVRLGWSGTMETHPRDPGAARGQIGRVIRDTGCQFWQIGRPEGVAQGFGLTKLEKMKCTGWVDLPQYPYALSLLDVGVVPLDDTAFNQAKSALKGLEMAALGVPFVASPTADYRRIAKDGIGILVDRPREWYRETRRLVMDHQYRTQLAAQMRARVAELATIEGNAYRWAEAWETAVKNRRSRSATAAT